ncbi:epidermal growth factor-like protein 7 isoform X2 [Grus americana]|uniref:epidermal growth factor-like protein 7 isoform X2 n=1 Tax=Grus americana TaxID=9117 RepID=UPI002407A59D|nr:epidermal growth factor-like protein 7 isoform X2 [Grus americana]XP_054705161.1 epidermal growth factor-like protein 7 isoform X2 [Grus americana]XP_054705162.1 epidermal growth factor-like protein 7 isoform X2 [Grus americana]
MCRIGCLLSGLLFILSTTSTDGFARAGRRVCAAVPQSRTAAYTESHVQPVYQPYLTTCQGHRLCSTYRTIYRVAYRQAYRQLPQPVASCCPGWSRANSHTLSCNRALCWVPCQNGGSCTFPGRCACPPGWTGRACQTGQRWLMVWPGKDGNLGSKLGSQGSSDLPLAVSLLQPSRAALASTFSPRCCSTLDVDECAGQSHGCGQLCINTAGSYRCTCQDGFSLAADNKACQPLAPAPGPETFSQADPPSEMKEEMKDLKSRVEALEQKLQLVLAPFHNLMPSAPEDVGADPISRLSHSLQQLDRIDSLSEQISFLEERLETCSCKNEL